MINGLRKLWSFSFTF